MRSPQLADTVRTGSLPGCINCRSAHTRCDESKPICRRCDRLAQSCSYSQPAPRSSKAVSVALNKSVRPLAPAIRRDTSPFSHLVSALEPLSALYFDYFRQVVVSQLCTQSDGPTGFWSTTLLCECTRDASALDAVIGIAALSRARHEALYHSSFPAFHGGVPGLLSSAHYAPAVQHYSKAIAGFRQRITTPAGAYGRVSPRTLLVYTMLFSVFETLHGNTSAFDHLVANGLRLFHGALVGDRASPRRGSLTTPCQSLNDSDVYEAECFLTRTATWSALFSPMYPQSRRVLARIVSKSSVVRGELLLGLPPPDRVRTSVKDFWRLWWQFITRAVLWHLRARTVLQVLDQSQEVDAQTHGDSHDDNDDDDRGRSENENPYEAVTRAQLEEEQRLLTARSSLWMSETRARLDEITHPSGSSDGGNVSRDIETLANERILITMIFDIQICHLSGCFALDSSESAWSSQSCLDKCNAALDVAQDIVADLTDPGSHSDSKTPPTREPIMSDGLLIGLLQLSRECRDRHVRWRAFGLAKRLVSRGSTQHVRSLVLGTWACMQAEEKAREPAGTGRIPLSDRYDWTAAQWVGDSCALHVVVTSRGSGPRTVGRKQERLMLTSEMWNDI